MTKVRFQRAYDRFEPGDVELFPDGVADALCNNAADGEGPFAVEVGAESPDEDEGEGDQ